MFRQLTDDQVAQLHTMLDVNINQHNSLHIFALAAVTLMRFELQDEMDKRAEHHRNLAGVKPMPPLKGA